MDRFTEIGMAALGTAYLAMKEDLVRKAKAEVDRFVDLFQSASLGMVIWQLEDPSDLGSFRLVTANPAAARSGGEILIEAAGRHLRDLVAHPGSPPSRSGRGPLADRARVAGPRGGR
ncbi:MAG: hypothetical protein IPN17_38505 [Deltaproteobacteria bacterium]|nr:hypothetical protein [Deltaproteobacteria bacterium]